MKYITVLAFALVLALVVTFGTDMLFDYVQSVAGHTAVQSFGRFILALAMIVAIVRMGCKANRIH